MHRFYFSVIYKGLPKDLKSYAMPVPVAARSMAWVCGRSLAGIVSSNSAEGHGCLSVVSDVCCQVEVCATG